MNGDEDNAYAEEYYNCGYDGLYESREKAIPFDCVGRGLKLPPLSEIYIPPFLLKKGYNSQNEAVRPSHHVLELLSTREVFAQKPQSTVDEKQESKPQSSRGSQLELNDAHSEYSDPDVYISDEESAVDELDYLPAVPNFQDRESSEKGVFLPGNMVGKAEVLCTSSGNKVVITKANSDRSGLNDSDAVTSDDEVFSNLGDGKDRETDSDED